MRIEFTSKADGNDHLILLFTGWSCSPSLHSDLMMEGWDIAVVHDYCNFDFPQELIHPYSTIYLFAWSLGVRAAASVLPPEKITVAIAINGSLSPVDDELGIPHIIFEGTRDTLSPRNLEKFRRRMAGSSEVYNSLSSLLDNHPDIENLKGSLSHFLSGNFEKNDLRWKKAFISDSDAIFPPRNLEKAWERENVTIERLNGPHLPDFRKIISSVIPDTKKIGRRFFEAGKTYEKQAVIQKEIAARLSELIKDFYPDCHGGKVAEIGPGTGFLTRLICPILKPSSIDLVDLSGITPEGLTCNAKTIKADAEKWIDEMADCYDAIVSSSTFQWFSNLGLFLSKCASRIRTGGILAFSTFLKGNLHELDSLRPSLVYPNVDEIKKWLEPYFEILWFETIDHQIKSDNPIDLLRHLKETGVGGSAPTPDNVSKLRQLRQLTYRPAFFIGRRK